MEILSHYKNLNRLTINLNFLFEEDKKNMLLDTMCTLPLKH